MNRSMPGLPVHHLSALLEFTQTHVHQVGDSIQPSHQVGDSIQPSHPLVKAFATLLIFLNCIM